MRPWEAVSRLANDAATKKAFWRRAKVASIVALSMHAAMEVRGVNGEIYAANGDSIAAGFHVHPTIGFGTSYAEIFSKEWQFTDYKNFGWSPS